VVIVDERSGTQSPLIKAFVDRFGIVKDASTSATSNQPGQLPSDRLLSDNLVLTAYGQFDFSRCVGAIIVGHEVCITAQDMHQEGGAIQAQKLLSINASGKVRGSGSYSGGTSVAIVARSVDL
jgi:hypothetical protein